MIYILIGILFLIFCICWTEKMDKHQIKTILDVIDIEGFDYAFVSYSDFEDIENEEFHKARKEFLKARERLAKIVGYVEN